MSLVLAAEALAERLAAGEAALLPTDTLPALAAMPLDAQRLWQLKQRPAEKPLILMGASREQLMLLLGVPWREEWLVQARLCWPGATTLVLPIDGPVTRALNPGGRSLGLRVPAAPLTCELLRRTGPLATTSANRSGAPAALDADQAGRAFPELALLAPLPWPAASGQASQVLAWVEPPEPGGNPWIVLRPGGEETDPAKIASRGGAER